MGKRKVSGIFKMKSFLSRLREIVEALPTESEKQEAQKNLATLSQFLMDLKRNFESFPTIEDINNVKVIIQKLEELLTKAKDNPAIAHILGLTPMSIKRRKKITLSEEELTKARTTLTELEALPVDEIRLRLQDESFTVSNLRAIANVIGIKSIEKLNREALMHQITTRIANYRGYQQLKGQK